MILKINGKQVEVLGVNNLEQLVAKQNLCAEKIVLEHNLKIVSLNDWPQVVLQENDQIEIVSFVCGG